MSKILSLFIVFTLSFASFSDDVNKYLTFEKTSNNLVVVHNKKIDSVIKDLNDLEFKNLVEKRDKYMIGAIDEKINMLSDLKKKNMKKYSISQLYNNNFKDDYAEFYNNLLKLIANKKILIYIEELNNAIDKRIQQCEEEQQQKLNNLIKEKQDTLKPLYDELQEKMDELSSYVQQLFEAGVSDTEIALKSNIFYTSHILPLVSNIQAIVNQYSQKQQLILQDLQNCKNLVFNPVSIFRKNDFLQSKLDAFRLASDRFYNYMIGLINTYSLTDIKLIANIYNRADALNKEVDSINKKFVNLVSNGLIDLYKKAVDKNYKNALKRCNSITDLSDRNKCIKKANIIYKTMLLLTEDTKTQYEAQKEIYDNIFTNVITNIANQNKDSEFFNSLLDNISSIGGDSIQHTSKIKLLYKTTPKINNLCLITRCMFLDAEEKFTKEYLDYKKEHGNAIGFNGEKYTDYYKNYCLAPLKRKNEEDLKKQMYDYFSNLLYAVYLRTITQAMITMPLKEEIQYYQKSTVCYIKAKLESALAYNEVKQNLNVNDTSSVTQFINSVSDVILKGVFAKDSKDLKEEVQKKTQQCLQRVFEKMSDYINSYNFSYSTGITSGMTDASNGNGNFYVNAPDLQLVISNSSDVLGPLKAEENYKNCLLEAETETIKKRYNECMKNSQYFFQLKDFSLKFNSLFSDLKLKKELECSVNFLKDYKRATKKLTIEPIKALDNAIEFFNKKTNSIQDKLQYIADNINDFYNEFSDIYNNIYSAYVSLNDLKCDKYLNTYNFSDSFSFANLDEIKNLVCLRKQIENILDTYQNYVFKKNIMEFVKDLGEVKSYLQLEYKNKTYKVNTLYPKFYGENNILDFIGEYCKININYLTELLKDNDFISNYQKIAIENADKAKIVSTLIENMEFCKKIIIKANNYDYNNAQPQDYHKQLTYIALIYNKLFGMDFKTSYSLVKEYKKYLDIMSTTNTLSNIKIDFSKTIGKDLENTYNYLKSVDEQINNRYKNYLEEWK